MKRKGFTLIELLAVIVILAVIALITVPMILNTIEKARKQAFLDSAYGIIEAGEYFYTENILNDTNALEARYDFEVKNKQFVYSKDNTQTLSFKGEMPKTGMLQVNRDGKTAIAICNDTYCACKSVSELKVTLKETNCNIDSETGEINDDLVKDGTPSGTVISYMGNHAPEGYLSCDGSVYNISEYQNLANQIKEEFGSYNYYGGDGTTTFAVPDLRGEFLRGTGTSIRDTGSGENVGVHQDPTIEIASMAGFNNSLTPKSGDTINHMMSYQDKVISRSSQIYLANSGVISYNYSSGVVVEYTARPTNTSVLYCIKY